MSETTIMNRETPVSSEVFLAFSDEEKEAYIKQIVGSLYVEKNNSNYHLGFPIYYFDQPAHVKLLHEIVDSSSRVLTSEEERIIYEGEKNSYKLHLQVPDDRKLEVLAHLAKVKKEDELENLHTWKMKDLGLEENSSADFVFYVRKTKDIPIEETTEHLVRELALALEPMHLEAYREVPRFSTPVVLEGVAIPYLSIVQGNGDFKNYLLRTGGEEKLAQFYSAETNYAFRTDSKNTF